MSLEKGTAPPTLVQEVIETCTRPLLWLTKMRVQVFNVSFKSILSDHWRILRQNLNFDKCIRPNTAQVALAFRFLRWRFKWPACFVWKIRWHSILQFPIDWNDLCARSRSFVNKNPTCNRLKFKRLWTPINADSCLNQQAITNDGRSFCLRS